MPTVMLMATAEGVYRINHELPEWQDLPISMVMPAVMLPTMERQEKINKKVKTTRNSNHLHHLPIRYLSLYRTYCGYLQVSFFL